MINVLLYLLLLVLGIASILINIIGMPGLWAFALLAGIYAWLTRGAYLGVRSLLVLMALALVAELVEFFAASAGTRRAGGGRRAFWGSVVGGIVGGIVGSPLLPIIGTIVGVVVGTFAGALVAELTRGSEVGKSLRVGYGAARGRVVGTICKLAIGTVMFLVALVAGFPHR